MSLRNVELQTLALHIGAPRLHFETGKNIPLPKAGVLTNPGISIFGDAVDGEKATVTIYPVHADSNQPSIRSSLFVNGNSVLQGDSQTANALTVSGGDTHTARFYGLQHTNAVYIDGDLFVSGSIDGGNKGRLAARFGAADASPKPFDLKHPTKGDGHRLRYACIEGPEVGVYYRGRLTGSNRIELPSYWKDLVHAESITVQLQPIGVTQKIIVMDFDNEKIILSGNIDCFFHVYGERKDINPLIVEYEGNSWEDYPDPNYNPNKVDSDKKNTKDPRFDGPPNTITK